ncbi:MAG: ribonuclease HI family protein [Promethearchaeota archaeon]|nr:MAG: RNaseHI-like [Helarchaeota virus Nidhogg Meg22_1012]URC17351.1 MAG: RNaseHI-like [Helarchaeota virus Nidhogg Meg22_1214]
MKIWFDGGARPENPGPITACAVSEDGECFELNGTYGTNNQAEWLALHLGVLMAYIMNYQKVHLMGDSKLVVNQFNDKWKSKDEKLKMLKKISREVSDAWDVDLPFEEFTVTWIPRKENRAHVK